MQTAFNQTLTIDNKDTVNDDKPKHSCICGLKYTSQAGLSRHGGTCEKCMKTATANAIKNKDFTLRHWKAEAFTYDMERCKERMMRCNTEDAVGRLRVLKTCTPTDWARFKDFVISLLKTMYFITPEKYTFYVPNLNQSKVLVHSADGVITMSQADLIDCLLSSVLSEIEDIIAKLDMYDTKDGEKYPLYFMFDRIMNDDHKDNDGRLRGLRRNVHRLITDYKDDMKVIWKNQGLL
jgi:hypothetical protein